MRLSDAAVRHLRESLDAPDVGPRYEIRELIGRGGMGSVFRAFDRTLAREVAVKVLSMQAESDALAERLAREARILARLEHPGVVAVHDAGVAADGRPFYVMRLVRGTWLDARAEGLGLGEVLRLFLRVCDAVSFAHARGVIHRDLTPRNVMVGEFGEVLVLDWGVATAVGELPDAASGAKTTDPAVTLDGAVVGTPGFMAPEQAAGESRDVDVRADVYGLGAILKSLIHGRDVANLRALSAIAAVATALDRANRYPTVEALAMDVRRWLDAEPVAAYRETAVERIARFYRRNKTLILLLVAYAVVRVAILVWRGV